MQLLRAALICAIAATAGLAPADSRARRGGGRGGMHPHHHQHVHGAFIFGFFPWPYYSHPPPYYYGPDFGHAHYAPPAVYVEKFPGTPTPETPGEFYCPDQSAFYPETTDCPGGWQRVIRPSAG